MDWPNLVDRLATQAGIEPFFYDIHGTRHETALGTKVLVLSSLGFDVSSPTAVAEAIADADRRSWAALSAFCAAGRADTCIDIVVPAEAATATWSWRLELESGEIREGAFRPEDLFIGAASEIDGVRLTRRRFVFAAPVPAGYHRLLLEGPRQRSEKALIAVPDTCYLPKPLADGARLWGLSTHLYTLRSEMNWGIGDFADLEKLLRMAGDSGASFVAVNPFHALRGTPADHASPYLPSSRLFLNPLYIDIRSQPLSGAVAELRRAPLIDYAGVAAVKRAALEQMWSTFEGEIRNQPESSAAQEFARFVHDEGVALQRFATFCALDEIWGRSAGGWRGWPARFRDPASPAVAAFAEEKSALVRFHCYLQFLAERQLAKAQRMRGMAIGIVGDLALGIDPDGADAWMDQPAFAAELRCGAPRDAFHPTGQEWGVLPFNPVRLREVYTPFVQLLRANMRHAGGLRIDHIIGIERQFLVPLGEPATKGCYVRYPREELLGLIALESHRNQCMVIGEDLGTVPEGLRERMDAARIFGCSILQFERGEGGRFRSPMEYRKHSLASAGTHDLPTLRGWWHGADIAAREHAGLQGAEGSRQAVAQRSDDKRALLNALREAGALTGGDGPTLEELRLAVHAFLTATTAQLFAAQLDDLLDEEAQLNVPGTVDAYPNWRRKVSVTLEESRIKTALAELAFAARRSGRV